MELTSLTPDVFKVYSFEYTGSPRLVALNYKVYTPRLSLVG